METVDDETSVAASDFIQRQARTKHAVLRWFNANPHAPPQPVRPENRDKTRPSLKNRVQQTGMIETR